MFLFSSFYPLCEGQVALGQALPSPLQLNANSTNLLNGSWGLFLTKVNIFLTSFAAGGEKQSASALVEQTRLP